MRFVLFQRIVLVLSCAFVFTVTDCEASSSTGKDFSNIKRDTYGSLPKLEENWSRIYVSNGVKSGAYGRADMTIYVNGKEIGYAAFREHLVFDLAPGTYEVYCEPPKKIDLIMGQAVNNTPIGKSHLSLADGETHHLACEVVGGSNAAMWGGAFGGLLGAAIGAGFDSAKSPMWILNDRKVFYRRSKLVGYQKLDTVAQIEQKSAEVTDETVPSESSAAEDFYLKTFITSNKSAALSFISVNGDETASINLLEDKLHFTCNSTPKGCSIEIKFDNDPIINHKLTPMTDGTEGLINIEVGPSWLKPNFIKARKVRIKLYTLEKGYITYTFIALKK